MRKTGLKRFVPIIARDPTKKNAGNREISTAFLGKFPVENSPYSNIKTAGKNQEQPKISQKSSRPASPHETVQQSGAVVCVPLRGVTLKTYIIIWRIGVILRPLAGCDCPLWRAFLPERRALSYVPLRGVMTDGSGVCVHSGSYPTSPCGV